MPHDRGDTVISLLFPRRNWKLLVPCHQKVLLLARHIKVVPVEHVERRSCYRSFTLSRGSVERFGLLAPRIQVIVKQVWFVSVLL